MVLSGIVSTNFAGHKYQFRPYAPVSAPAVVQRVCVLVQFWDNVRTGKRFEWEKNTKDQPAEDSSRNLLNSSLPE